MFWIATNRQLARKVQNLFMQNEVDRSEPVICLWSTPIGGTRLNAGGNNLFIDVTPRLPCPRNVQVDTHRSPPTVFACRRRGLSALSSLTLSQYSRKWKYSQVSILVVCHHLRRLRLRKKAGIDSSPGVRYPRCAKRLAGLAVGPCMAHALAPRE